VKKVTRIIFLIPIFIVAFLMFPLCVHSQSVEVPPGEISDGIDTSWDYFHDGDFQNAVDNLKKMLVKFPDDPFIEHTLGVFYMRERSWDEATKYFQESMMHTKNDPVKLWNHIYLAEILREQGFGIRAEEHLSYVEKQDLSSQQVRALAKIRMDLKIMGILDETSKFGNIIVRYPHYLLPQDKIENMGQKLNRDWGSVANFLNLNSDESIEIFIYPSDRLMEKYFPPTTTIREEDFLYGQVHTLFHGDDDYISEMAPYGYFLLARKYNRHAAPPWWVAGLDDAVRGTYKSASVNSWVSELFDQEKLPALRFLLDSQYLPDMDPDITNPSGGSFVLFLKNKFHPNDFYYILTQPNLEFNFKSSIDEINVDWIRWAKRERSIIENQDTLIKQVEKVKAFVEPPVVGMDLVDELKDAARLYESKDKDGALKKVETILVRQPRYGEALYLQGKILNDMSKVIDASNAFTEALIYLPPSSLAVGWANYFMGRIAKLKSDYAGARDYYSAAIAYPLPADILQECKANIIKLEKFLSLNPDPTATVAEMDVQNISQFLGVFDDLLRARDWSSLEQMTARDLNPQQIESLLGWYKDKVTLKDDTIFKHELIKAQLGPEMARLAVNIKVSQTSDEPDAKPKEFMRYFLLTRLSDGWRIIDYFDDLELYK
jgi:tetratricopeptide (TPR) repeat protein